MNRNRQRGFTLVELLIALLLGAIVAVTLTMITRSMVNEAKNQQQVVEASAAARAALDIIRMDLMRVGMFVAVNPRRNENRNSMVTSSVDGLGSSHSHAAYFRNTIVHLNAGNPGPDSILMVGNFIGDRAYEAEIDDQDGTVSIANALAPGMCETEFNPAYAFAHIITATGQTHEAKVVDAQEGACVSDSCDCELTFVSGEIIQGAFGERNVKVAANQALLYRVESIDGQNVLMRYFVNYDGTTATECPPADAQIHFLSAMVVAQNVTDFQIWFRPIDPGTTGGTVDRPLYHGLAALGAAKSSLRPTMENPIVGLATPATETQQTHLACPVAGLGPGLGNELGPEHMRSAIVTIAVRTERTDQFVRLLDVDVDTDSDTAGMGADEDGMSDVVGRELAAPPADDVGMYRTRRYYTEVNLPNVMSQMATFQWQGENPPQF